MDLIAVALTLLRSGHRCSGVFEPFRPWLVHAMDDLMTMISMDKHKDFDVSREKQSNLCDWLSGKGVIKACRLALIMKS